MTSSLSSHLSRIVALCERVIEADNAATAGPWNQRWFSCLIRFARKQTGYWEDIEDENPGFKYPYDEEESATFIAISRNFSPAAATAVMASIQALRFIANVDYEELDELAPRKALNALQSIADSFPDV